MKILKVYVINRSRPEGCIIESYIVEEAMEFCSDYLSGVSSVGACLSQIETEFSTGGRGSIISEITRDDRDKAHRLVLQNITDVQPYIERGNLILGLFLYKFNETST